MLEKTIETAYCAWIAGQERVSHLTRQLKLPVGRADVFYLTKRPGWLRVPVLVEIKAGKITDEAAGQLLGYMMQLDSIFFQEDDTINCYHWHLLTPDQTAPPACVGVLVGSAIDDRAARLLQNGGRIKFVQYIETDQGIEFDEKAGDSIECDFYHDDLWNFQPAPILADAIQAVCQDRIDLRVRTGMLVDHSWEHQTYLSDGHYFQFSTPQFMNKSAELWRRNHPSWLKRNQTQR
jgi:hypothetical protein